HAVDLFDDAHARDDLAEGREAHRIEPAVVSVVDEDLGRAHVRTGGGEGDGAFGVRVLRRRIVLEGGGAPDAVDRRIAVDAELHHEALDDAEEGDVVVVAELDEVVEAIGAERRPVAMHLDHEVALGRRELHFVGRGRRGRGLRRRQERAGRGVGVRRGRDKQRERDRKSQSHCFPPKRSRSSAKLAASAKPSKVPCSMMVRVARMKPPHAARDKAEPTEMRRTPSSVSRATVMPGDETSTLTGFGATARTILAIIASSFTPGAYKQSAPASANAARRSSTVRSASGSPTR